MTPDEPQSPQNNTTPPQPPGPPTNTPQGQEESELYTARTQPLGMAIPPKKSKKKIVALVIAAIVLVLLIAAGVAAWLWYQHPQKVVHDALAHALQSERGTFGGTLDIAGRDMEEDLSFALAGQWQENQLEVTGTTTVDGQEVAVNILNNDDGSYVKVDNFAHVLALLAEDDDMPASMREHLVSLTEDKWIAITSEAVNDTTTDTSIVRECIDEAVQTFYQTQAQQEEIVDLYKDSPLFSVEQLGRETINETQSYHYSLTVDESHAQQFASGLQNTAFGQALQECGTEATPITLDTYVDDVADTDVSIEFWVSVWAHELTQVEVRQTDNDQDVTLRIAPSFDEAVDFPETPADEEVITLEELLTAFIVGAMEQAAQDMDVPTDEDAAEPGSPTPGDDAAEPRPTEPGDGAIPSDPGDILPDDITRPEDSAAQSE